MNIPLLRHGRGGARLLPALTILLTLACEGPDRTFTGGSAVDDSARRAMTATDFEAPVDPDYLLGADLPPYPGGVESLAGSMLRRRGQRASAPDSAGDEWGLDHVRVGGRPALLLKRVVSRTREPMMDGERVVGYRSTPTWRVEDVLVLPQYSGDERVELGACFLPDGAPAVGIGVYRAELRTIRPVRVAWRVDREGARLVSVDPARVRCQRP